MSFLRDRARLFEEMGLGPEWRLREKVLSEKEAIERTEDIAQPVQGVSVALPSEPAAFSVLPASADKKPDNFSSWEELVETIRDCTRCGLCKTRTRTVPGVGDIHADWLFVGEGPGYHEDQQGEPFVGRSGMLLDNMMASLGIRRGDNAYIANIVKCRASDERKKDRQPTEEEAAACMPYLHWQIGQIRPKVIVALGKTAAVGLLNTHREVTMSAMRGKTHRLDIGETAVPLIVTYHPAYLLRTPMAKKQAWADLCLAAQAAESV
ncbi:MAG: uracil-DNA glycosylase [Alistipes senegalensis]|nr:uracil-DNA glycosylase [Oxalobacter formigenes]MCM1281119.1 uracil-DNA glycosylase [Alistipes senegalensis]